MNNVNNTAVPQRYSFAQFLQRQQKLKADADRFKTAMKEQHGEIGAYLETLEYGHILTPSHARFGAVYQLFAQNFVENGKPAIPAARFEEKLAYNNHASLQKAWGPFRYVISYAYDPARQQVLGMSIHLAMRASAKAAAQDQVDVLQTGNFTCTAPDARGVGVAQQLLLRREDYACDFVKDLGAPDARLLLFAQHNDPLMLLASEYLEDNYHGGLDQCDRVLYWHGDGDGRGYRRLDFAHLELPNAAGAPGYDVASLNLRDQRGEKAGAALTAETVIEVLRRYNAICRKDGADPSSDRDFRRMADELTKKRRIKPIDMRSAVQEYRNDVHALMRQIDTENPKIMNARVGNLLKNARTQKVRNAPPLLSSSGDTAPRPCYLRLNPGCAASW